MISHKYIVVLLLFFSDLIYSQQPESSGTITLENAYTYAIKNYPLIKDGPLIEMIEEASLSIIAKNKLPRLSLNGVGQIQSENIELSLGANDLNAPLETFNTYLSMEYDLYDGGLKKAQKEQQRAASNVDRSLLEVQLNATKERVNNLLFGILLSRKQKLILETSIENLDADIQSRKSGYNNGTVLQSEVYKLEVRKLELTSDLFSAIGDLNAYTAMLSQLLGVEVNDETVFIIPQFSFGEDAIAITRPELEFYGNRRTLYAVQVNSLNAALRPKISFFAQGGVGNPNPLNFSDFSTSPYALGGVKLAWTFTNFGKRKKEKQLLDLQKEQILVDEREFIFNTQNTANEYRAKIDAIKKQIKNDREIYLLQQEILSQSRVQLDNGVIKSNDYLTEVNAAINAAQQLEFKKIQLQQYTIKYLTLLGQL
ncbi:TolC family protein [Flavobacteriaceae bacterium M23B6Z8]